MLLPILLLLNVAGWYIHHTKRRKFCR